MINRKYVNTCFDNRYRINLIKSMIVIYSHQVCTNIIYMTTCSVMMLVINLYNKVHMHICLEDLKGLSISGSLKSLPLRSPKHTRTHIHNQ